MNEVTGEESSEGVVDRVTVDECDRVFGSEHLIEELKDRFSVLGFDICRDIERSESEACAVIGMGALDRSEQADDRVDAVVGEPGELLFATHLAVLEPMPSDSFGNGEAVSDNPSEAAWLKPG
jgi:hypothetical protein